jgi:hypothetical protein
MFFTMKQVSAAVAMSGAAMLQLDLAWLHTELRFPH